MPLARHVFEFDLFQLDLTGRTLFHSGRPIRLAPKLFDTLAVLVQNSGHTVQKDELMREVWPDTFVEENNLNKSVSVLRKVLGETPGEPSFIETVPKRGYRFIAGVKETWTNGAALPKLVSPEPSAGEALADAFVGRVLELQRLREMLEGAVSGSGRAVFITGEAGIGKTALVDQFVWHARADHPELVLGIGRCVEQYGAGEAYLPFLDLFGNLLSGQSRESVATVLRAAAPTWCQQFPAVFSSREEIEHLKRETIGATKERMLREMGEALEMLSTSFPVVLLLEDLQWADPSSTDLIRRLGQGIGRQRLLVIGTYRPDELALKDHLLKKYKWEMDAHGQCEELWLGMLGQNDVSQLLDLRFTPNRFPREMAGLIHGKTEGHPLFTTSLVQYLLERRYIVKLNDGHWELTHAVSEMDLEVPESARGMIRRKLDALEKEDRRTLEYASIEGEEFTSTVLAGLLGADELALEERIDRLSKTHHLVQALGEEVFPDGMVATRYRFSHVLYQNLLYEELVPRRRVLLHRRTGDELIRHYGDQAARIAAPLAMHFHRGGEFHRAIQYLTYAGDNAVRRYANAEAEQHYSQALLLVESLEAQEQSEQYLTLYHKRGQANFALSRFQQAVSDFTEMTDHAHALASPTLECTALNALSHVLFFTHRLHEMGGRTGEALRVAEMSGDESLRALTLTFIARRQIVLGNLLEAKRMLDESIRLAIRMDYKPALIGGLGWRGVLHYFHTEYESAERTLTRTLELSSELRDSFMLFFSLLFLGLTRANLGRVSEALAAFDQINELAQRNGERYQVLKVPNSMGWIHRELGDLEGAAELNRAGVEIARRHQVLEAEVNSAINLSYDYTCQGETEKATRVFADAEILLGRDEWTRWRFGLRLQAAKCEHLLSRKDLIKAEACARRLFETASRYEARKYVAIARNFLAEVAVARGDVAGAAAELHAALELLRQYPAPLMAWKTYATLGRLHSRSGAPSLAQEAFDHASAIIRMIATNVNDQKLRSIFLESTAVKDVLRNSSARGDQVR